MSIQVEISRREFLSLINFIAESDSKHL